MDKITNWNVPPFVAFVIGGLFILNGILNWKNPQKIKSYGSFDYRGKFESTKTPWFSVFIGITFIVGGILASIYSK